MGRRLPSRSTVPIRASAVLRAFSSALLADSTNDNSITNADNNKTPITVKTDNSGDAKVYVVPGS